MTLEERVARLYVLGHKRANIAKKENIRMIEVTNILKDESIIEKAMLDVIVEVEKAVRKIEKESEIMDITAYILMQLMEKYKIPFVDKKITSDVLGIVSKNIMRSKVYKILNYKPPKKYRDNVKNSEKNN